MSWVSLGSANLVEGSTVRGYVYFEYDDTTTGVTRGCRLRIVPRPNHTFNVNFNNITVAGVNYGSQTGLTQNSGVFWTGNVSGGQNVTASWTNPWYAGSKTPSITGYLPAGATAPSGLDVTITSVQDTSVVLAVSLNSYGAPDTAAGRYIEGAILGTSTYGAPYRYATSAEVKTATITVNNTKNGALVIAPNTQYHYGAYATNTALNTSIVKGTITTLPAYITALYASEAGGNNVNITVAHAAEGSATPVTTEYSYNQSNWTTASDNFQITLTSPKVIYVRRRSSAGVTPMFSMSLSPYSHPKLYGSVNGYAEEITKLYGSVNGESKKIVKLYGSANGVSELIYEDAGNA